MEILEIAKYTFMGIFLIFFAMDILSKKSYKTHFYVSLTLAIIFLVLGQDWSTGIKMVCIVLVTLLTIKTIVDEKKKQAEKIATKGRVKQQVHIVFSKYSTYRLRLHENHNFRAAFLSFVEASFSSQPRSFIRISMRRHRMIRQLL
ncbi:hypothetical protein [Metasolibacillus meyeri]|uniref:hypothetical protein n=1 Tax=Metasolibacillus meyeri TaxID=1071052 RepID=UPI000D2FEC33|nr:hypothetical protein [Metasolibacillus meyeri]